MHTQEKAPTSGASNALSAANHNELSVASQSMRLVEHAKTHGFFTRIDGWSMGIMNVSQRVTELKARGVPIEKDGMVFQYDHNGIEHRVARYVWRGDKVRQGDLWEGC